MSQSGLGTESAEKMCSVCHRVLNDYMTEDGAGYVHGFDADHEPVPVPVDGSAVLLRCDLCGSDIVGKPGILTVRRLRLGGADFGTKWALDAVCTDLVKRDRWPSVTARAAFNFARETGASSIVIAKRVGILHAALRQNTFSVTDPA